MYVCTFKKILFYVEFIIKIKCKAKEIKHMRIAYNICQVQLTVTQVLIENKHKLNQF